MLRLHERTVEQSRLERVAEQARLEMEAADHQVRTLNQLKADRRARLRTEYSRCALDMGQATAWARRDLLPPSGTAASSTVTWRRWRPSPSARWTRSGRLKCGRWRWTATVRAAAREGL